MMPLEEFPINHIRRNGSLKQSQEISRKSDPRIGLNNSNDQPAFLQDSSSIQRMLRNTTETGNVGQFSVKPSRVPPSATRASPSPSSINQPAKTRNRQPGGYCQRPDANDGYVTPVLSRHGTSGSQRGPISQTQSQRSHPEPSRGFSFDDYRSSSMTQNSFISHSLTNRNPYAPSNRQGRADMHAIRPRSPFVYPTRLKRPGYRPSSPALSERMRLCHGIDPAFDQSMSSRTASPSSIYTIRRVPALWQQNFNRSDPQLRHYPPGPNAHQSQSPTSSRPSTPKPSSSLRSVASISCLQQAQQAPRGIWTGAESPPESPLFYDYTEAFEDQAYSHPVNVSNVALSNLTIHEDVNISYMDYGLARETSEPIELAADKDSSSASSQAPDVTVNKDSQSTVDVKHKEQYPQQKPNGVLKPPQNHARATPGKRQSVMQTGSLEVESSATSYPEPESPTNLTVDKRENQNGNPTLASSVTALGISNTLEISRESDMRPSSPTDSMYSVESSAGTERRFSSPRPLDGPMSPFAALVIPRTSIMKRRHDRIAAQRGDLHTSEPPGAFVFQGRPIEERTEIFAPTPERSISSPSNHDRFSKILSVDEGLLELEEVATASHQEEIDNGNHNFHTNKSGRARSTHSPNSPSVKVRNSLDDLAQFAVDQETDSDDEHELTNGLLETFGKSEESPVQYDLSSPSMSLKDRRASRRNPEPLIIQRSGSKTASSPRVTRPPAKTLSFSSEVSNLDFMQPSTLGSKRSTFADKDLPLLPKEQTSVVSFGPPNDVNPTDLPFAFTPLVYKATLDDSTGELESTAASFQDPNNKNTKNSESPSPQPKLDPDRSSNTSSPGSRPWNLDASYPWSGQLPKLDVTLAQPAKAGQQSIEKIPRFKLKIHRASSSSGRTAKITKRKPSSEVALSKLGLSQDQLPATISKRKTKAILSAGPGRVNSSHDVAGVNAMQTRFVESFEDPSTLSPALTSPTITLLPPSPGHEVQSFFSDDSSQIPPRGSLRQRFSHFRSRNSRANFTDEGSGYDRGLLGSAFGRSRASGRSSRQSENTAGAASRGSQVKNIRLKVIRKLRIWFQWSEDIVRDWGWKMRSRDDRHSSPSVDLYAGV